MSVVTFTSYLGINLPEAARVALTANLYVRKWQLKDYLQRFKLGMAEKNDRLSICFMDDKPIACTLYLHRRGVVMAFCKMKYRRRGYASKCIAAMELPDIGFGMITKPWTESFWKKNNIVALTRAQRLTRNLG